jgi:hypothetical protein
MNRNTQSYTHDQFIEDMEWAGQIHFYRNELRTLKQELEMFTSRNARMDFTEKIRHTLKRLTCQQDNLEEIAHIARKNELTLILKLQIDPDSAGTHRTASRIKEQSLLRFFVHNFLQLRADVLSLCKSREQLAS